MYYVIVYIMIKVPHVFLQKGASSLVHDRKAFFHFGRNRNWPKKPFFFSAETDTETEKNFLFRPKPKTETEKVQ